jgi:phage terminase large subunit
LTSVEWVEHKKRAWGEDSARYKSKVLGEFPDEADNTFFPQATIDSGFDTVIEEDDAIRPTLGLDVARFGSDENVFIRKSRRKSSLH